MTNTELRLQHLQQDYDKLKREFTLSILKLARELQELKTQLDLIRKLSLVPLTSTSGV